MKYFLILTARWYVSHPSKSKENPQVMCCLHPGVSPRHLGKLGRRLRQSGSRHDDFPTFHRWAQLVWSLSQRSNVCLPGQSELIQRFTCCMFWNDSSALLEICRSRFYDHFMELCETMQMAHHTCNANSRSASCHLLEPQKCWVGQAFL